MTEVTRSFCWHQNFVPWGCMPLPRGYIHVLNHEKECIKSDFKDIFFKLATNEWSDKTFLLTSKLCPLRAGCLCPGAIYMCKIMKKKCIKSDFKEKILKLATNYRSDKMFLLTSKFRPQGVVSPCPGAIYIYKIMKKKKMSKIRLQRENFETCNKLPKWQDVPVDIKISSPRGCQPLPRGYIHI